MKDTVMVYTCESLDEVLEKGGSGNWVADASKVASCKYVVLVKSRTSSSESIENDTPKRTAFLIGKITGTRDSAEASRILIEFGEYAELSLPDAWTGNQNPVAYLDIKDLEDKYPDFSLARSTWRSFPNEKVDNVSTAVPYWNYIRQSKDSYDDDFTQLFANAEVFHQAIEDLTKPFKDKGIDKVAAIDAAGFALGGAVAYVLGAGLVHIRKEGKISWDVETEAYGRDYNGTNQVLEIASDAIQAGDNVLVVDDWAGSGRQLKAAFRLIDRLQARVAGAALLRMVAHALHDGVLFGEYKHEMHYLFSYEQPTRPRP